MSKADCTRLFVFGDKDGTVRIRKGEDAVPVNSGVFLGEVRSNFQKDIRRGLPIMPSTLFELQVRRCVTVCWTQGTYREFVVRRRLLGQALGCEWFWEHGVASPHYHLVGGRWSRFHLCAGVCAGGVPVLATGRLCPYVTYVTYITCGTYITYLTFVTRVTSVTWSNWTMHVSYASYAS
jgi:hypothetical protein